MRAPSPSRSLVLVAGSGRSGTSLFAGLMQRLGFLVPQPEVPADVSNPRGFAESQWVVDFHTRLLDTAMVQTADARPSAWASAAAVAAGEGNMLALRRLLEEQYANANHVVIKDPRLCWFLPLWSRAAQDMGLEPKVVTMLRHPAAVVDSKSRYYGSRHRDVGRIAGWLNTMLFTERATRDMRRVFVRYEDLLDDWPAVIASVGDRLDLDAIRNASTPALRKAHQFIDPGLSRSSASWDPMGVPDQLQQQADDAWTLLSRLADKDGEASSELADSLDEARTAYLQLYDDAEAIAQSSVWGAGQAPRQRKAPWWRRTMRKVPRRYRQRVPLGFRRRVIRTLRTVTGRRAPGRGRK